MEKQIHWEDIGYTIICNIEENSIDFSLYESIREIEFINGETINTNTFTYEIIGSSGTTNDIEKAQPVIKGHIKYDGCSHVDFGDDGYIHICGSDSWLNFIEAIKRIYDISKENLRSFEI